MNENSKYMDWLWRIHDLGLIEKEDLDREAGRLYGFNKCCIDNYITIAKSGIRGVAKHMMEIFGPDEELLKSQLNNPHVRCAKCRKLGR